MVEFSTFDLWLGLWMAGLAVTLLSQRKASNGAGLVLSYVMQLWVIHWLGASIWALPWFGPPTPTVFEGLVQSTYAIAGFTVGHMVFRYFWSKPEVDDHVANLANTTAVHTSLVVGLASFLVIEPLLHSVASVGAVASAASNLLIVALALECWNGLREGAKTSFWRWIVLSAMLPMLTVVTRGYLSYGFAAMLTVYAFVASFYRPRWRLVIFGVIAGYMALSVYVTYMRDRRDIRESVWAGEAYSSRFSSMSTTLTDFEFLDLTKSEHLQRIDGRLNQNYLLGRSVEYMQTRPELFAKGRTLVEAVLAPVPRALWKEKTIAAGSGDLVSEFTGMRFGPNTSVGIGHVMELYVNFGSTGVFVGMVLLGMLVSLFDARAIQHLRHGRWPAFVMWWLPGLGLLQVGGSFVDTTSAVGSSFVVGWLFNRWMSRTAANNSSPSPALTPRYYRS